MVDHKHNNSEDPEEVIETAIDNTEFFIRKNGKKLLIALAAVIVIVGCFFGYKYAIEGPRENRASDAIFAAEQLFAADSFEVALKGNSEYDGFLTIANDYSATATGNIANHYAGICYIKLGDFDNALKHLKKYNVVSGIASEIINAQNLGLQGDVYSEQNNSEEAIKMYVKASETSSNALTTPYYLKKAGMLYMQASDNQKALAAFTKIKNEYPTSMEGRDIDKYIGQAEQSL